MGQNDEPFTIPKDSFTAFRLTYSNAKTISETSKTVFLGSYPDIWYDDKGPELFARARKFAKGKMKKKFASATTLLNTSIRSGVSRADFEQENQDKKGKHHTIEEYNKKMNMPSIVMALEQLEQEDPQIFGDNHEDEDIDDEDEDYGVKFDTSSLHLPEKHRDLIHDTTEDVHFDENDVDEDKPLVPIIITQSEDTVMPYSPERTPEPALLDPNEFAESVLSSDSTKSGESARQETSFSSNVSQEPAKKPSVKFRDQKRPHHGSRISIEMPKPMELADTDVVKNEKERHRYMSRLRKLSATSRKAASARPKIEVRKRFFRRFLKRFKSGEVILVEKFLVMTKVLRKYKFIHHFDESENCDSRIHEKWTEYYFVLRKADHDVLIQMYDATQRVINPKQPDINFRFNSETATSLYSASDKSFSIMIPSKNGAFVYICQASSQNAAMRTLCVLKYLGEPLNLNFNIAIPDISLRLNVKVPVGVFKESLNNCDTITINPMKKGYRITLSPVLEYLKNRILQEIELQDSEKCNRWLDNLVSPWFCFKQYDRLDWTTNNSETFYYQNQVLKDTFQLQFRDSESRNNDETCNMQEPTAIEGFLYRMTNLDGKEKSHLLRSFHKISYFYTSDDLLFSTKYYLAQPPGHNYDQKSIISGSDTLVDAERKSDVFVHSPYPLDENDHITWLNNEDFETHDKAAYAEFQRRAQHILRAEAVIEIGLIKDIRFIPKEHISKAQNMFFAIYWHSNMNCLVDDYIMDSAFEIEMINGSVLKLQAPNRFVRNEWVSRLTELSRYWRWKKQEKLNRQLTTRLQNQIALKIPEYADSNVTQEIGLSEIRYSVADPLIHNLGSIAMSRSILMSGPLYEKGKKHSNFNQYYVVLCPGSLILFSIFKRSKSSGIWKKTVSHKHYFTIPISECYLYSGNTTAMDLLDRQNDTDSQHPSRHALPRLYPDGWKSSEEEHVRCFTLYVGKKRQIKLREKELTNNKGLGVETSVPADKNAPHTTTMLKMLGITGKSIVFMARSRQDRELWTDSISTEIARFAEH